MENNFKKNTTNKTQSTKTTATTIKTKPKTHTVDLEPKGNPFARRGSVNRSPPMLTRSDSRVSVCSIASLLAEGKQSRAKLTKSQALTQNKKAVDFNSANVDSEDATASYHNEVKGDCESGKQNIKSCIIQEIYKKKPGMLFIQRV